MSVFVLSYFYVIFFPLFTICPFLSKGLRINVVFRILYTNSRFSVCRIACQFASILRYLAVWCYSAPTYFRRFVTSVA